MDELTTGLHFEDIKKLLEVLQTLVDQGNTILMIEHNLEIIKTAVMDKASVCKERTYKSQKSYKIHSCSFHRYAPGPH